VIYGTVDVAVPVALSFLGRHHGWEGHGPGPLNLVGLVPLVAGAALILWAGAGHIRAWRDLDWLVLKVDPDHLLTPDYLVVDGLYRYSRNPLYVGDTTMWLGWAVTFGSVPVVAGLGVLLAGLQVGVRFEERGLARQFGSQWTEYARATPRFIGVRRDGPRG